MPFDLILNRNVSSSQKTNVGVDMSDSKADEKSNRSEFVDSGLISDTIISEEISSDADAKDDKPRLSDTISTADISDKKTTQSSNMILDSGIDIDLSDQLYSKSELLKCEKPVVEEPEQKTTSSIITVEMLYTQDEDGDTQLHCAIMEKCEEIVKYIVLATPASKLLDIQNNYAQTCLHLSIITNLPRITRLLMLAGAKTNIEDCNGNTPLHLACKLNNMNCVEALLTPIATFEQNYYPFKYKPELDLPKNYLNEINYDGLSCTHIAVKNGDLLILHKLLMNGADINVAEWKAGFTVLHEAVIGGNLELVRYILHHPRIDLEKKNYASKTAYQLSFNYPAISQLLLEKNAQKLEIENSSDEEFDESDSEDEYEFASSHNEQVFRLVHLMQSSNISAMS